MSDFLAVDLNPQNASDCAVSSCPNALDCGLYARAQHPLIGMRPLYSSSPYRPDLPAVLCIGEAPGHHEDRAGRCWVGLSGTLLTRFLEAVHLPDVADIYLTNACRCYPMDTQTPPLRSVRCCRAHLRSDALWLLARYPRLILFCLGSVSAYAAVGIQRLSTCFHLQAQPYSRCCVRNPLSLDPAAPVTCFFSYHPAVLLPSRRPALAHAAQDHFLSLFNYLQSLRSGSAPYSQLPSFTPIINQPIPDSILADIPLISLDIETYGVLKGRHQSVFHPVKSAVFDAVPYSRQVVSAAFACLPSSHMPASNPNLEPPPQPSVYYYTASNLPMAASVLERWHQLKARQSSVPPILLGQNIRFDIQYLRCANPQLAYLLSPLRFRLEDTLLWSFLLFEQRPENSLKDLARLFALADYNTLQDASNALDPALVHYNCADAVCALCLFLRLLRDIRSRYGAASPKFPSAAFDDPCSWMRNAVLWSAVSLESAGFCLHQPLLENTFRLHQQLADQAAQQAADCSYHLTIKGEGSAASVQQFLSALAGRLAVLNHPQLKFSEKTRQISSSVDNLQFLLSQLNGQDPDAAAALNALIQFKQSSKLLSTYLTPLLSRQRKGYVQRSSSILHYYPHWYPIPLTSAKDPNSSASSGGTIQGRFSCKDPAAQTFPPSVKDSLCSRWGADGLIISWDLSQIELRIAALLSGDPLMLSEYHDRIDRHTQTGLLIAPHMNPSDPAFKPYRQAGKTLNFLVLYLGQAAKFQETLRRQLNIHLPLSTCQQAIQRFDQRYTTFRAWQRELIRQVQTTGCLTLPTGWSRTFGAGAAVENAVNEIVNFPIQTIAAQLMQSAQYAILCRLEQQHLRARVCLQIHDAIYLDTPRREINAVCAIVEPILTRPPLLSILEEKLNRTVPILFERTDYDPYAAA